MIRSSSHLLPKSKALRNKRIGRKVLLADRLAYSLSVNTQNKTRMRWRAVLARPKIIAAASLGILVLGTLGFIGVGFYSAQLADIRETEAARQLSLDKEEAAKADACRRAKLEQKADLVGKVTYDELYDGDECDK